MFVRLCTLIVKYRVFRVFELNLKNKNMLLIYDGIKTDSRWVENISCREGKGREGKGREGRIRKVRVGNGGQGKRREVIVIHFKKLWFLIHEMFTIYIKSVVCMGDDVCVCLNEMNIIFCWYQTSSDFNIFFLPIF